MNNRHSFEVCEDKAQEFLHSKQPGALDKILERANKHNKKCMNTYIVYLFDSTELEIKADDYTVYTGDELVGFKKDDENIAWFSLHSIVGFMKNETGN